MRFAFALAAVPALVLTTGVMATTGSTDINVDWDTGMTGTVATDTIDLPAIPGVASMVLDLSHTWAGDLEITVDAPGGAQFILMMDEDGSGDLGVAGTGFLDDVAAYTFVESGGLGGPNGDGTFQSGLNASGEYNANTWVAGGFDAGTWTITIADDAGGDGGAVGSWSIKAIPAPGALALLGLAGLASRRRRRA